MQEKRPSSRDDGGIWCHLKTQDLILLFVVALGLLLCYKNICIYLLYVFFPTSTNVPYQLSALKKQSYIWWCHKKTNCLLLLWISSSRTLLCRPIRWTPTGDRRNQHQAILSRCVNLRKDGMTCQNHRATYCNINSEAPNIRLVQSITVALNIQIYERAKALILKSLWLSSV